MEFTEEHGVFRQSLRGLFERDIVPFLPRWEDGYFRDARLLSIGGSADEVMLRALSGT